MERAGVIEAIATFAGILGAAAVSRPRTRMIGFGVWIVGNLLWVGHGILIQDAWLAFLFGAYEITAIVGFVTAYREESRPAEVLR